MAYLGIWRYPINQDLTALINLPGVEIRDYPSEDSNIFYGTYAPKFPVVCPNCNSFADTFGYEDYRTISDRVNDRVVTLIIEKQKYRCPNCKRGLVAYQPDFVDGGESVTKRYKDWLARNCLTMSPQKVSALVNNQTKQSIIKRLFSEWCEAKYEEYISNLIPSPQIGIHLIEDNGATYFIVTDLKNNCLIDVYDKSSDPAQCLYLLSQFALSQAVQEVCSSIDVSAMAHSRGIFAHSVYSTGFSQFRSTDIAAALCSIHTELVSTICKILVTEKQSIQRKVTDIITLPIYETIDNRQYGHVYTLLRRRDTFEILQLIQLEYDIRVCLQKNILSKKCYDNILAFFDRNSRSVYKPVNDFVSRLNDTSSEINIGFSKPSLQRQYQDIDCELIEIIQNNRKCSFPVLRARLLFTFAPDAIAQWDGEKGTKRLVYTGINFSDLKTLSDYDA